MKREEKETRLGFAMDEVMSAYQKEIRRGNTLNAIAFALEGLRAGQGSTIGHRMKTILSEDIGIAHPNLPHIVCSRLRELESMMKELKDLQNPNPTRKKKASKGVEEDEGNRLEVLNGSIEKLFVEVTIYLSEAPKSRLADNISLAFYHNTALAGEHEEMKRMRDEELVDRKMKKVERLLLTVGDPKEELLRPLAEFWAALKEGNEWRVLYWLAVIDSLTVRCAPRPAVMQKQAKRPGNILWLILDRRLDKKPKEESAAKKEKESLMALRELYWEGGAGWPKGRRSECLHIINAVLRVMRRDEDYMDYDDEREIDPAVMALKEKQVRIVTERKEEEKEDEDDEGHVTIVLSMPDYAVDKHTRRGKAMGRGLQYFFEVGALLNNTRAEFKDPYEAFAMKWELVKDQKGE